MIKVTFNGNTYGIKEVLKGLGFRWNAKTKEWTKTYKDSEETTANEVAQRWTNEGVYGKITKE